MARRLFHGAQTIGRLATPVPVGRPCALLGGLAVRDVDACVPAFRDIPAGTAPPPSQVVVASVRLRPVAGVPRPVLLAVRTRTPPTTVEVAAEGLPRPA